ncbi:MAG: metal ABC transporter permease [Endomicrobia bacterium]|nr:metal ABC transporter permease [Endomicrobiia bacterium]
MNLIEVLTSQVLIKSLLVSFLSSSAITLLGIFVVLKKSIFITLAISEVAGLGLILGLYLGINPYGSMILITFFIVILFSFYKNKKYFSEDKIVAIIYALSFCLSIILLSKTTFSQTHIIDSLVGNVLAISNIELILDFVCFLICVLFFILFHKQLFFIYSDPETSCVFGLNYNFLNFLFFLVVGFSIVCFLKSIGIILSFSYLSIPCSFAIIKAKKISDLISKSLIISLSSSFFGTITSFIFDIPLAATIVIYLGIFGVIYTIFIKS